MNFKRLARLARMPADDDPEPAPAKRRRPATRKGRPTLTRELIAESALEIAGTEGFPAVTMRRLAEELGVTVRALYRYVDERQEVVDLAAALFLSRWEVPPLDPGRWQEGLRTYLEHQRALYRRHPRALLVSLDEQVSPAGIHPNRLRNPEALLGLLRGAGLGPRDASYVHSDLARRMFAFTLLVDHPADRGATGDPGATGTLPDGWAAAHPGLDLPHLTEAARLPAPAPDELFEELVRSVLADVTGRLERGSEPG
ncbi:TetR family transcriptional regulator [Streptomyces sp. GF20]|nr:TetR family transcriptional regulator [Streptomyces sp. GF20]